MSQHDIDGVLGFLLNKGNQALHRQLNRNFISNGFDITHDQWSILAYLFQNDGNSQQEIGDNTYRDKVSITKIIDNLEKRELVYRKVDLKDRRVRRIFLTKKGKVLVPKLKNITFYTLKEVFSGINQNSLESFKQVLSKIVKNVTGENLLEFINKNKVKWK